MKFGMYSSIANPPRGDHLDRCVDQVIAEAQLAEASGFDSCFFGEHHQDKDGFLPSPLIVATVVAAQTQRLNVGTSVILLLLLRRFGAQQRFTAARHGVAEWGARAKRWRRGAENGLWITYASFPLQHLLAPFIWVVATR